MQANPSHIIILGCGYDIVYTEGELEHDGYPAHACIDTNKNLIEVVKGPEQERWILHETVHGILHQSGLSELLDERLEEAAAIAIENGLWQAGYRRTGNQ